MKNRTNVPKISRTYKIVLAVAVAIAAILTIGFGVSASATDPVRGRLPDSMNHVCPTEDSVNCYWDATQHGNGQGRSFVVRKFKNQTCFMFQYTLDSDYCEPNS